MLETNKIHCGNCLELMKRIPDNSIDLIVTDPPYNLSTGKKLNMSNKEKLSGFGGDWKITNENWDKMTFEDYFKFTTKWLFECKRVLCNSGGIWVFGSYHNIGIINVVFQKIGLEILNEIIWYKPNAFPNLSCRRFTASHENILWGHKSNEKNRNYCFNYDEMKAITGKQIRSVWEFSNNKTKEELQFGTHPTQKPLRIINRIIEASSNKQNLILDPFMGSGTTMVVCKQLSRNFIGIEINSEYCEIAQKRLDVIPKRLDKFIGESVT